MAMAQQGSLRQCSYAALALGLWAAGCTEDPTYVEAPDVLELDPATVDPDAPPETIIVELPIRLETPEELMDRTALADELGVEVPYVGRDDLDISIEWTVTNLDPNGAAQVELFVNGANEYFNYIPAAFVIDPQEDEEPPPLVEGIPVEVPADGTLSGVFREDQIREASIDLELITRAGFNPFMAILPVDEDRKSFDTIDGLTVPEEAMASLVRFEVGLTSNRAVRLEFAVRVRDRVGIVHKELLRAPAGELTVFMPADYAPPAVMP